MTISLNKKLNESKKHIKNFNGNKNDYCFFEDCENKSIKSHSISESKVLSLIEGENEKKRVVVLHLENYLEIDFKDEKSISSFHKTHRRLKDKGKADSSVFYGFCENCDNSAFKLLDNSLYENTQEMNFLLTLRTKAYNLTRSLNIYRYYKKNIITKYDKSIRELSKLDLDFKQSQDLLKLFPDNKYVEWKDVEGLKLLFKPIKSIPIKSFRDAAVGRNKETYADILNEKNFPMEGKRFKSLMQKIFNQHEKGLRKHKNSSIMQLEYLIDDKIKLVEGKIKDLTYQYRERKFNSYNYLHISIPGIYPISGAFMYNYIDCENDYIMTFFPEQEVNKTHFIIAVDSKKRGYLSSINIKSNSDLKEYLSNLILNLGSNIFLSPKYWSKLPDLTKQMILSEKSDIQNNSINLFSNKFQV